MRQNKELEQVFDSIKNKRALEHVAQKWEPVLRAQHAIKQELRAPF
jgi:hypothetical protein